MNQSAYQYSRLFQGRRRFAWLSLVLISVAGIAWGSGTLTSAALSLARQSLSQRDEAAAIRWIGIAQSLDSRNAAAEALLARLDRHHDRFDEAEAHLRKARVLGLDSHAIRREEMLAEAQAGRLKGIEADLNVWLAEADLSDRREICEAYANGLAIQARFADAIRLLEAWRADFPDDPQPDYRMGRIYEHMRQKPDAEARYRASLERRAEYYPAAYALGRVLLDRKEAEEALTKFRKCLELPHPVAAQVGMGSCLKALGKIAEARSLFEKAARADKREREASYASVGEPTERFAAAIELGKLETEAGHYEAAEGWLRKAVEADPRDSEARYAWAVALRGTGNQVAAEKQFEIVRVARTALDEAGKLHDHVDQHPDDAEARYRLGVILLEYDSERAGLYWLGTALSCDPQHAATHRALADFFASKTRGHAGAQRLAEHHRLLAEKYGSTP